ncbi:hypothetical protein [Roseivirga sp.]|uniref:hypothetical protein n=1 Tax=Roseivirga sp. TaxID=1964215 RepID=UPI003B8DCD59
MNKTRIILLLLLVVGMNGFNFAQSSECTAPEGFVCGSKKGVIYKDVLVWTPMGPMPRATPKDCCVASTPSMACNAVAVGCNDTIQLL